MKTVLVVEDSEDLRELLTSFLKREGYAVLEAENGQQALDVLQATPEQPGLILLDIMMPIMDGPTFLATLRERGGFESVPTVIVSAVSSFYKFEGAQRVLQKPVSADVLRTVVQEFCGPP